MARNQSLNVYRMVLCTNIENPAKYPTFSLALKSSSVKRSFMQFLIHLQNQPALLDVFSKLR